MSERGEREEINPLEPIIIPQKNHGSDYSVVTTTPRISVSVKLHRSIIGGFRQYVKYSGLQFCEVLESAMLEYMQKHHTDNVTVNITQDLRSQLPDMKNQIQLGLAKQELDTAIDSLRRALKNPNYKLGIFDSQTRLRKALNKAIKTKATDQELFQLIKQARSMLGL